MPLVFLVLLFPFPKGIPAGVDHLEAAVNAARDREARLHTLSIAWKRTTHIPKGGIVAPSLSGMPQPRVDQTLESTHRLILDGILYRQQDNNPNWAPGSVNGTTIFDGTRLTTRRVLPGEPAQFVRCGPAEDAGLGDVLLAPITYWCRGRRRWEPPIERDLVSIPGSDQEIDGVRCLEFQVVQPSAKFDSYWLDTGRGYLTRQIRRNRTIAADEVKIDYRDHPGFGLVPSGWTETRLRPDGTVVMTVRVLVTEVRIGERVAPETFRLDPSPGDTVFDNETNQTFRARLDGSLQEIDPASGVPLPRNDTRRVESPGRKAIQVLIATSLFAFLLFAIYLRRRSRAVNTPSS